MSDSRHLELDGIVQACYIRYSTDDEETLVYYKVTKTMLTVSCRDVGMDYDYVCKGETEGEIMKNAEQHAVQDHHYKVEDITTAELQQKIRSHIKRS